MGRGPSKKKMVFEIPEPGMADVDDDDLPPPAPAPKPKRQPKAKPEPVEEVAEEVPVAEPDPTEAKPKAPKPEKEYPPGEYWRMDGPRYDVSLQDAKEKNKYLRFDETENLADAKDLANNAAFEDGRVAIVWDRKEGGICYRIDPNAPLEEDDNKKGKKK